MHPAPLMQTLMDVVGGVKITAQHALEVLAQHQLDDFPAARVVILIVAYCWGTHTPDVAVLAVFSPARVIRLHGGTGPNGVFEGGKGRGHRLREPMADLHNLSATDLQAMQGLQIG